VRLTFLAIEGGHANLVVAVALGVGVLAQALARHLRVPSILLLLIAGVLVGPDGLGWVRPASLGGGLFGIVEFAVAVILFEGGLNLEVRRLRREQTPIRRLVTWGALITGVGATLSVRAALGWDWIPAALFGSLVIVTGPTVIGPLLRDLRLGPRVATVLEAEGVLIDPVGALIAVVAAQVALAPHADAFATGAAGLLARLAFGTVAGAGFGLALALLLRHRRLLPEGLANVFTLAWVFVVFQVSDAVLSESGILAVTVAGIVVGNTKTPVDRDLREFKDQLTVLLIGLLFVLLAADVRVADLRALGWGGVLAVGLLVVVVRPLNVLISTLGSDLRPRDKLFLGAMAPRGIVAAAVATLVAGSMQAAGVAGGSELRALVFLTIAGTVALAGLLGRPLARLLGVQAPPRDVVAILGAEGLGLALGTRLREASIPILFIDSNPLHCRAAEEAGFPVTFGNGLDERTLARARFDRVRSAVGLTSNESLNSLFTRFARDEFQVPEAWIALDPKSSAIAERHVGRWEARVLFDGPKEVERWNVRLRHRQAVLEEFVFRGAPKEAGAEGAEVPEPREALLFLTVLRDEDLSIYDADFTPEPGDIADVAIYEVEREAALRTLASLGWQAANGEGAVEAG
jgi:NhaP-type Na+/H+ or K+/H+ antiporter